ncbi:MAG: hypothetical protein HQL90_03050 [Magnetococcales bacterium]|nr:hypothetical protein [Magnetococcales bacterium]
MATLSKFERFSKNLVFSLITICLVTGILEIASYLLLRFQGLNQNSYTFSQIISGYYVFRNTPGAALWQEVKEKPSDPPTVIDGNGFVSDHPIAETKPPGVTRIFLMGGSAVFGIGQFPPFASVHSYHRGVLSFALSPAGQLERYLRAQRPDLQFEVINAAASDRMLHQSMIYYLETLSRFSPDMVVSMDGYNDLFFGMMSGRPYAQMEAKLENYIDLLNRARSYQPNLVRLLNIGYSKYVYPYVEEDLKKQFFFKGDFEQEKYSFAAYKQVEGAFIHSSQRFLQILDHFMAVLKSDKVDFIFTLQPILYRQVNKQWSTIEDRMRRTIFGVGPNMTPELIDRYIVMSRYFFDQYLSRASQQRVEKNGFGFMDLNQGVTHLKSDFELYIDYCHFTVPGSKVVAELVGQEVLRRLPGQQKK